MVAWGQQSPHRVLPVFKVCKGGKVAGSSRETHRVDFEPPAESRYLQRRTVDWVSALPQRATNTHTHQTPSTQLAPVASGCCRNRDFLFEAVAAALHILNFTLLSFDASPLLALLSPPGLCYFQEEKALETHSAAVELLQRTPHPLCQQPPKPTDFPSSLIFFMLIYSQIHS